MPLDTGEYPNVPGLGTALQWLPEALYYAELHALGVPSAEEQLNMAKMLSGIAPESGGDVNAWGTMVGHMEYGRYIRCTALVWRTDRTRIRPSSGE